MTIFGLCLTLFLSACKSNPAENMRCSADKLKDGNTGELADKDQYSPASLYRQVPPSALPVSSFGEIWAYLIAGREQSLKPEYPLTDVGYFGADLDSYGHLIDVPNPKNLSFFKGRLHLVVSSSGRALTHFALAEGSREREQLVGDLLQAVQDFDGLQIDFENVPDKDGDVFLSFLQELRAGLGNKIFTIALPARTRTLTDDVYDYKKILPLVDRILVMAYDEHWSGSEPGPIASMDWCEQVASYSFKTIGQEKLIMGLPFYGRSWGSYNANRAFFYSGIERIIGEENVTVIDRKNNIPTFSYEKNISVTVYFEDEYSLSSRLQMYKSIGVESVGFWRLGQETPAFWPLLNLE